MLSGPRILFVVLLLLASMQLLPAPARAQTLDWNRLDDPMYEALGLNLGLGSGVGLAYKFPVRWWLYAQASGGIWNNQNDKRHNLGLELQYILRQSGRDKLYCGLGAAHFYHQESGRTSDHFNVGFGVGLERLFGERTAVQAEATFIDRGNKDTLMLFPQVGVYYYF